MGFQIDKYHFKTGSLLKGLPMQQFKLLKERMVRMEEKKGAVVYREGSYPKGVYILRKGKVKIFQTDRNGDERIVYIYKKGEMFGYRPIISRGVHPVSAQVLEDCVISFIPAGNFLKVVESSLEFSNRVLMNLSHEFTVWTNRISVFAHRPVRQRLALCLLILNEKYGREKRKHLPSVINLSRDDMGNYIGAAKETLVRSLLYFKRKGIVSAKGRRIMILKPKELERIADL